MANSILSGVAGAFTVTVLNELVRRTVPHAPRLDVLGMRSLAKASRWMGAEAPEHLFASAMAGDMVANTAYYSLVGAAGRERAMVTGAVLGLIAGIGAVALPAPMGLGVGPTDRTTETKFLSIAMYLAGGIVAGAAYSASAPELSRVSPGR